VKKAPPEIVVRAVKSQQGDGVDVYAFFLRGSEILQIADITRIERDEGGRLKGFQRKEIRNHVNAIVEYLDSGASVLFPNAIILALSPGLKFTYSRGPLPQKVGDVANTGSLTIPVRPEGQRVAWVVDGQQRSLALERAQNQNIPVPVIAFVSSDLETQRGQFILVNKAKPLPHQLITELLPEVSTLLPRDLQADKLPSVLCNLLNSHSDSPFRKLIRRASSKRREPGVVSDTALIAAIRQNLKPPYGALRQYKNTTGECDGDAMFGALVLYWSEVRAAFPEAWGRSPEHSRLMHSVGIRAMGAVMDPIMVRADSSPAPRDEVRKSLARLAPSCCWTEGTWEGLGWKWNEVQSTAQNISRLADHLIGLDRELSRQSLK
jgi:DGQHR domain-containing protein